MLDPERCAILLLRVSDSSVLLLVFNIGFSVSVYNSGIISLQGESTEKGTAEALSYWENSGKPQGMILVVGFRTR